MTKSYLKWEGYKPRSHAGWTPNCAPSEKFAGKDMWRDTSIYDVCAIPALIYMLQKTWGDYVERYPELKWGFRDGKEPEGEAPLMRELRESQQQATSYRGMFASEHSQSQY